MGWVKATDLVTCLSFDGRSEEAFKCYEKVFKGEVLMMRHSDAPRPAGVPRNSETTHCIMRDSRSAGACP